jgi:phospholipid/cholesterol/gamma-HCH transport system ATP-binding protein
MVATASVQGSANPYADAHVVFSNVCMAFDTRRVFEALNCRFPRGKISVILGGSGSGKSTVLRLIGGLVRPQAGRIVVDGRDITRLTEREIYGVRQKLGMMFQGGALLDSMTVFDNMAFPLREHTRLAEAEIAEAVHECLHAVGLTDVDRLLPGQLSGGMTKRVALARAIIRRPVILLCDEPFSGLDPISGRRVEALLCGINRRLGVTMIVVSHHVASTMRMAAHVLVLLPEGAFEGTTDALRQSNNPRIVSFLEDDADETLAMAEVEVAPA